MSKKEVFNDFRELMYDLESYLSTQAYRERNEHPVSKAAELTRRVSRMIVRVQEAMGLDNCDSL